MFFHFGGSFPPNISRQAPSFAGGYTIHEVFGIVVFVVAVNSPIPKEPSISETQALKLYQDVGMLQYHCHNLRREVALSLQKRTSYIHHG